MFIILWEVSLGNVSRYFVGFPFELLPERVTRFALEESGVSQHDRMGDIQHRVLVVASSTKG